VSILNKPNRIDRDQDHALVMREDNGFPSLNYVYKSEYKILMNSNGENDYSIDLYVFFSIR